MNGYQLLLDFVHKPYVFKTLVLFLLLLNAILMVFSVTLIDHLTITDTQSVVNNVKCKTESFLAPDFVLYTDCEETSYFAYLSQNGTIVIFSSDELENMFVHVKSVLHL